MIEISNLEYHQKEPTNFEPDQKQAESDLLILLFKNKPKNNLTDSKKQYPKQIHQEYQHRSIGTRVGDQALICLAKASEQQQQATSSGSSIDEDSCFYTMGPRAAIEIGRRQVIFFCGEILDEELDPTMLQELEAVMEETLA